MKKVSDNYGISIGEAKKTALEVDKKRKEFREYFLAKNPDANRFDLSFNCEKFSIDEIVQVILKAADLRKMI